ncbi:G1/S-specific cyclin-D2-like [Oratosquilla oratoria]|uniref:G1/S-specific cyclin-D2-like n=1 Tax=Oratosquilla oratoria TaxID=337810 RepID=UPI003F75EE05
MEDLYCNETPCSSEGPLALEDPNILENDRVLHNLVYLQRWYLPTQNYFRHIQGDIQPYMRKCVAKWMLDVCEEQNCEDQVFVTSVNYMDRFLGLHVLERMQLQILGAACLLLASKMRQCRHLSVEVLSYYTDYSVTQEEIKKFEYLLVNTLKWDLSSVTGCDFMDHLLHRAPGARKNSLVRKHALTFVSLAATEPALVQVESSAIAAAAIVAAMRGLKIASWPTAMASMSEAASLDCNALEPIVQQIELVVASEIAILPQSISQQSSCLLTPSTPTSKYQSPVSMDTSDNTGTPKDIIDINF